MAGLNLFAAIVIYWTTKYLGYAFTECRHEGMDLSLKLTAYLAARMCP